MVYRILAAFALVLALSAIAPAENLTLGIGVNLVAPGPNSLTAADLMAKTSSAFVAHTVIGTDGRSRFSVFLPNMSPSFTLSPYQGYIISSPRTQSVSLGAPVTPSVDSVAMITFSPTLFSGPYAGTSTMTVRLVDLSSTQTIRVLQYPRRDTNDELFSMDEKAIYGVNRTTCFEFGRYGRSVIAYKSTTNISVIVSNPDTPAQSCASTIEDRSPTAQQEAGTVLFVRERYGQTLLDFKIMEYTPVTGSITTLTRNYSSLFYPGYVSPRRRGQFLFALGYNSTRSSITTLMRLLPTETILATFANGVLDFAISPNGELVAFSAFPDATSASEIYTIRNDGSELKRLTTNAVTDSNPWFDSNGNTILFRSHRQAYSGIHRMNLDGTNVRLITAPSEKEEFFSFVRALP